MCVCMRAKEYPWFCRSSLAEDAIYSHYIIIINKIQLFMIMVVIKPFLYSLVLYEYTCSVYLTNAYDLD